MNAVAIGPFVFAPDRFAAILAIAAFLLLSEILARKVDQRDPGRVFGEDFGVRSRRGAMIVDSLILANDVYTVSTLDCDPGTEGNQGYLPFILLAKGKIQGDGIQTEISVSARDISFRPKSACLISFTL